MGDTSGERNEFGLPAASTLQQKAFLAAYAQTGVIGKAAEAARISRMAVFAWRNQSEPFAAEMAEAKEQAIEAMELEARRRAIEGTQEPIYYRGELVGHKLNYSDQLLMFKLRAARPEMYRDNVSVDASVRAWVKAEPKWEPPEKVIDEAYKDFHRFMATRNLANENGHANGNGKALTDGEQD